MKPDARPFWLDIDPAPTSVLEQGACASHDPANWFPAQGGKGHGATRYAKAVCATCPVLGKCRRYAMSAPAVLDGIWGGLTPHERDQLRNNRPRRSKK